MAPEILAAMIGLAFAAPAVWLKRRADVVPPLVEAGYAMPFFETADRSVVNVAL